MSLTDLGARVDPDELPVGVPVLAAGGDEAVGTVVRVDGDRLVVEVGGVHRLAEGPEIGTLHERGAVLTLDAHAIGALPEA